MKEQWDSMKSMLRKKPIKKLCLIGALVLVVLAFAVYFSVYLTSVLRQANLMGHHLSSFPQVYDERIEELTVREDAYEKDYQIRADLGAKLYEYENESDRTIERLDAVRQSRLANQYAERAREAYGANSAARRIPSISPSV